MGSRSRWSVASAREPFSARRHAVPDRKAEALVSDSLTATLSIRGRSIHAVDLQLTASVALQTSIFPGQGGVAVAVSVQQAMGAYVPTSGALITVSASLCWTIGHSC